MKRVGLVCLSLCLSSLATATNPLERYESYRVLDLRAAKSFADFQPSQGLFVDARDSRGRATKVRVRVLSDNPRNRIQIVGDFNNWKARPSDELRPVEGTPYFETVVEGLAHRSHYRLVVNGQSLLDPASALINTAELSRRLGSGGDFLNSVFWDFEDPSVRDRFREAHRTRVPDLRHNAVAIAESEVYELVRHWPHNGRIGPSDRASTYNFIVESGVIGELKRMGYNAIEFLPFNASMDGDKWHLRYQVYGLFAPESKFGTPDEFARMIAAFNRAGILVIMDAVVGHYPFQGNNGARALGPVGLHNWKKSDGRMLFGNDMSPWNTYRYDYANPFVRRFLIDSILHMFKHYGLGGIRFDNLDGIRFQAGGNDFLRELTRELRDYLPEAVLIGEMFFGEQKVMQRLDRDWGFGINNRTHSDFFDFIKDNILLNTEQIDMNRVKDAIRNPWNWGELPRVTYLTNHDEAANQRNGATGRYLATLIKGDIPDWDHNRQAEAWSYVERKTRAYGALAMMSSAAYLDMPQLRLLQEGSFSDNPGVAWQNRMLPPSARTNEWFTHLMNYYTFHQAFAFENLSDRVENHTDYASKVISLERYDAKNRKKVIIVVNLNHQGFENYRFGVDTDRDSLHVALDSDRAEYGGWNGLRNRAPNDEVPVERTGLHGKSRTVRIPYLPPVSAIVLD